jgi:dihydropteroate synthase
MSRLCQVFRPARLHYLLETTGPSPDPIGLLRIKIDSALNAAFSDWGNILHDTMIATAIADRLIENSEVFVLGGESLRKTKKKARSAAEAVRSSD